MGLPIYVKWELREGTQGYLREGGKNYDLDVMFNSKLLKWKSFVNSNPVTNEKGEPILSGSMDEAKDVAESHLEKLLIEDGIFHKDGYILVDENGNPKKK